MTSESRQNLELIPEPKYAEMHGVTTRTLSEWEKCGILPPAIRIRGRKYRRAGTQPRIDVATARSQAA